MMSNTDDDFIFIGDNINKIYFDELSDKLIEQMDFNKKEFDELKKQMEISKKEILNTLIKQMEISKKEILDTLIKQIKYKREEESSEEEVKPEEVEPKVEPEEVEPSEEEESSEEEVKPEEVEPKVEPDVETREVAEIYIRYPKLDFCVERICCGLMIDDCCKEISNDANIQKCDQAIDLKYGMYCKKHQWQISRKDFVIYSIHKYLENHEKLSTQRSQLLSINNVYYYILTHIKLFKTNNYFIETILRKLSEYYKVWATAKLYNNALCDFIELHGLSIKHEYMT
jgi:hypothetical protein